MHWVNRILVALLVAGVLSYWPQDLELAGDSEDLQRVRSEAAALTTTNDELREQIRLVSAEIHALKTDPNEVARIAREDLNLIRPGEFVFEVVRVAAPRR